MPAFLHKLVALILGFLSGASVFHLGMSMLFPRLSVALIAVIGGLAALVPFLLVFSWLVMKSNPALLHFLAAGSLSVLAAFAVLSGSASVLAGGSMFASPILFVAFFESPLSLVAMLAGCLGGLTCWGYLVLCRQIPLRWH